MSSSLSWAWTYFDINANDKAKAICKLCEASISRGEKSARTFTTTNLLNHLKKIHPEEAKDEQNQVENPIDEVYFKYRLIARGQV